MEWYEAAEAEGLNQTESDRQTDRRRERGAVNRFGRETTKGDKQKEKKRKESG